MQLVEGNADLLRELVTLFLADCPKQMESIRAAVFQGDAQALHQAAHLLRGSLGNFGVSPAYEASRKLEAMARAGNLDSAQASYASLEAELCRLQAALAELLPPVCC
jgi:two-component system sensor histidine kinase/response regulator